MPAVAIRTLYAVEGLDIFGRWSAIGCWEDGQTINPTEDEQQARAFLLEMQTQVAEESKLGYTAVRLARTVLTHEVLEAPISLEQKAG